MKKLSIVLLLLMLILLAGCQIYPWEKDASQKTTWQDKAIEQHDADLCLKASNPTICLQTVARINNDEYACYLIKDKKLHDECIANMVYS